MCLSFWWDGDKVWIEEEGYNLSSGTCILHLQYPVWLPLVTCNLLNSFQVLSSHTWPVAAILDMTNTGHFHHQEILLGSTDLDCSIFVCWRLVLVCPTLCDPLDWSLPGFSVHGILQAGTLEWIAIFSSMVSSRPRDWTQVWSPAL